MIEHNPEATQRSVEELFLGVFGWYCGSVDLTFDEFLVSLSKRMDVSDRKNLRFEVFVDDEIQRKGEDALVNLANRLPNQGRHTRRWSDAPGRAVDWSQTWLSREMGRCDRFCNLERVLVPDKATRGALAGLASRWESVLESVPAAADRDKRLNSLRKARLALNSNRIPPPVEAGGESSATQSTGAEEELGGVRSRSSTVPSIVVNKATLQYLPSQGSGWSQNASRRLHHVDHEAAIAIDAAIRLWEGNERRGAALAKFVERWLHGDQQSHLRTQNANTLLEWTATLWVARAAAETGWHWVSYLPSERDSGEDTSVDLRKGQWQLRVSKGRPKSPTMDPITGSREDRVTEARRSAGLDPKGQQPDIVITFWISGDPANYVTYLGDAKRNETKDGLGYLSTSVMRAGAYLYAFGEWLHCRPRFTLFMWQGVNREIDRRHEDIPQAEREASPQKRIESEYPDIFCIHPGMVGKAGEKLKDWFEHLFRQAQNRLEGCQTGTTGTAASESAMIVRRD